MTRLDELKVEARRAWSHYADAIVEGFRFPKGSKIQFDGFEALLKEADEQRIKDLIADVKARTKEMREAKFMGER